MERLRVENLSVWYGDVKAVDRVSFKISDGEVLGVVGESGSGKSTVALSILKLLPEYAKTSGKILFRTDGDLLDILELPEDKMRRIRGRFISLVVQNPHSAFNPVFRVGLQVAEPLLVHFGESRRRAFEKVVQLFRAMGIPDPSEKAKAYPFELSGGMKQRAVVSTAIIAEPKLLLADEPTTALDPTVQAQILKILRKFVDEKHIAMLFISHDISVVGWISDRICVMYGGWIIEEGKTSDVLLNPLHPYTKVLLDSVPYEGKPKPPPGSPLDISFRGCRFAKRCPIARSECFETEPPHKVENGRRVKCFFPGEF